MTNSTPNRTPSATYNTPEYRAPSNVTWTNGVVSLTKDMIFGISVLAESGWLPISCLDRADLDMVIRLVDNNPGCVFLAELKTFRSTLDAQDDEQLDVGVKHEQATRFYLYYLKFDRSLVAVTGPNGEALSYLTKDMAQTQAAYWSKTGRDGYPVCIETNGDLHNTRDGRKIA